MLETGKEILSDIESTLEQLTKNAAAIKLAKTSHLFQHELESLERIQESLLARLMNRQSLLEMDKREKALKAIRKEVLKQKVVEYAKDLRQKPARSRKARSKS
jgi:membrane carboxypeptidase/penicillin-binding protein PbpC